MFIVGLDCPLAVVRWHAGKYDVCVEAIEGKDCCLEIDQNWYFCCFSLTSWWLEEYTGSAYQSANVKNNGPFLATSSMQALPWCCNYVIFETFRRWLSRSFLWLATTGSHWLGDVRATSCKSGGEGSSACFFDVGRVDTNAQKTIGKPCEANRPPCRTEFQSVQRATRSSTFCAAAHQHSGLACTHENGLLSGSKVRKCKHLRWFLALRALRSREQGNQQKDDLLKCHMVCLGYLPADPADHFSFNEVGSRPSVSRSLPEAASGAERNGMPGIAVGELRNRLQENPLGSLGTFKTILGDKAAEVTAMAQSRFENIGEYMPTSSLGSGFLSSISKNMVVRKWQRQNS